MYVSCISFLLLIIKSSKFAQGLSLSPIEVTYTCPNDQALLTCSTNGMFLEWNVTAGSYTDLRLISSSETRDIPSLNMNYTTLRSVRESRVPLNITLLIINTTVDWRISCTEYLLDTQNALETTIHVIRMNHINNFMVAVDPSFGESNVTLRVTLEMIQNFIHGLIYGVILTSSFEEIRVVSGGNNSRIELSLLYNTEYNLSTFTSSCGFKNQSHTFTLFYESNSSDPLRPYLNTTTSRSLIIISTVAALVAVIALALLSIVCVPILIKLFQSKSRKDLVSSNLDPHPPEIQVIPVYESVYPMEFQEENNLNLNDNTAYGLLPAARAF